MSDGRSDYDGRPSFRRRWRRSPRGAGAGAKLLLLLPTPLKMTTDGGGIEIGRGRGRGRGTPRHCHRTPSRIPPAHPTIPLVSRNLHPHLPPTSRPLAGSRRHGVALRLPVHQALPRPPPAPVADARQHLIRRPPTLQSQPPTPSLFSHQTKPRRRHQRALPLTTHRSRNFTPPSTRSSHASAAPSPRP